MQTPPHIQATAKRAAASVEALIIEMLLANELGEVAVIIGYAELTPERRVRDRRKGIKVPRGHSVAIEGVR